VGRALTFTRQASCSGKRLHVHAVGPDPFDDVEAFAPTVLRVEPPCDPHWLLSIEGAVRTRDRFIENDVGVPAALDDEQGTARLLRDGACGMQRSGQRGQEREPAHGTLNPRRMKNL
jgi:hypothetical protein